MTQFELILRPGVTTQVEVNDRNLLFYAAPRPVASIPDQDQVITQALDNPIGTPRLEDMVRPGQKLVIIIDDITRPTPTARILGHLLSRLNRVGIADDRILIFAGLGTHRPMTEDELDIKVGPQIRARCRVVNRDYREGPFVDLGQTASGIPIEVNDEILQADVKIAIGNIVPHVSAGWGGGSKILLPGVCSRNTSDMMHLMACIVQPMLEVLGTRDNKPRAEMDAVAERVGLDMIVNTVLDEDKNILGAFAGHYREAHRQATAFAHKVMVIPIPAPADILIVSAHPCHFDYWQGIKPYAFAHRAVRKGGIIILLLDGTEGLCGDAPSHEETVRTYMTWSFEDQKAAVERGEVTDLVGLNVPMYHAMLRGHAGHTICVSDHLTQQDLDLLGFDRAPSVQAALQRAYGLLGREARVGIIPFGGETLTRVAPDEA